MTEMLNPEFTCKAVIVGDGAIGKSCLLDTMTGKCEINWQDPEYTPTAALNYVVSWEDEAADDRKQQHDLWLEKKDAGDDEFLPTTSVELWDTAGQEALGFLRTVAYPDTNVFMLGYDMTRPGSLENVTGWLDEIEEIETDYCGLILVGTKYDLWLEKKDAGDDSICTIEAIEAMADNINAAHSVYTSAKTGFGLPTQDDLEFGEDEESAFPPLDALILQVYHGGPGEEAVIESMTVDCGGVNVPAEMFEIVNRHDDTWTTEDKDAYRVYLSALPFEDRTNFAIWRSMRTFEPAAAVIVEVEPEAPAVQEQPEEVAVVCESVEWPDGGVPASDLACKMVIVGDGAIGKSCLLDTLTGIREVDWENPEYRPTAAVSLSCEWEYKDQDWDIQLWDTAGQEALVTLRQTAYPDTNVFVIGFDMCSKTTLDNVEFWVEEIEDIYREFYGIILVGTKYDLWEEKQEDGDTKDLCTLADVVQMAAKIEANQFIYTSAKTGYGLVEDEPDDSQRGEPKDLQTMILDICSRGCLGLPQPTSAASAPAAAPAAPAAAPAAAAAPAGLQWPSTGNAPLAADDCFCKAVVVGDGAVGKTCLLDRVIGANSVNWDDPEYVPTAAANFLKEFEMKDEDMTWDVELWDTAGQEALSALRAIAYPETKVFLLTYDMTRKDSLENITGWKEEIDDVCDDYYGLILVGTKHDLWLERVEENHKDAVTEQSVQEVAEEIGAIHSIYTSAKTGYGLSDDGDVTMDLILDIAACATAKADVGWLGER